MLNYIKISFLSGLLLLMACETEIVEKLDEFSFEQGGYMRTVSPYPVTATTFNVSAANMAGTKMELVAEAVTPDAGALFSSYEMVVRFVDGTAANGSNSKNDVALRSIPASAYAKDAVTGYPRHTLVVTGKQMQDVLALSNEQIAKGDRFEIRATMVLTNGKKFNASNTGLNITGGAFYSSPFFYRVNVVD